MLLGPGNEILMSDSGRAREHGGSVYVLRDKNADGKIDEKNKIIDGLDRPYGLALWKEYLYVAETTSLKRYKYDAKTMKVTSPGEEIVSLKGFDKGHWTRTVLFDRKGEKLYLTVGSGSNVDAGEDPMRAAVHRYNPDGSGHETLVSGTRNVIGLRWYPGTDTLWGAVQERVERRSQAIEVAASVDRLAAELLGGGVEERPHEVLRARERPARARERAVHE